MPGGLVVGTILEELHTLLFSEADARRLGQELTSTVKSSISDASVSGQQIWYNSMSLMQKHSWLGRMSSPFLRGICWRICFKLFNNNSKISHTRPGRRLPTDATLYDIWAQEIVDRKAEYEQLLKENLPNVTSIDEDPLSSFSQSDSKPTGEWAKYQKKVELANFIKVDLERLYLTGLEEDQANIDGNPEKKNENNSNNNNDDDDEISFFFVNPIPERLLNILMLFSIRHEKVSYRQGMHEICGIVYYVLFTEAKYWSQLGKSSTSTSTSSNNSNDNNSKNDNNNSNICNDNNDSHPFQSVFSDEFLESQVYFLFSAIMEDLLPLYDPSPRNQGPEPAPAIVDFCTRLQEHFLLQVDADLCNHLQDCYIQGQIYGMRWSRLLLSREFPVTHDFSLKIWDYLFATCMELSPPEKAIVEPKVDIKPDKASRNAPATQGIELSDLQADPLADPLSHLLSASTTPHRVTVNATLSSSPSKSGSLDDVMSELPSAQASMSSATKLLSERYGDYSMLMGVLGDFMLAMLLHIRDELMGADSNEVLGLLMRYPKVTSVQPIMDYADMLRRGVLFADAHISPQKQQQQNRDNATVSKKYANAGLSGLMRGRTKATPSSTSSSSSSASSPAWLLSSVASVTPALNHTAKRMSENFSAAVSYVKSGTKTGNNSDSPVPSSPSPATGEVNSPKSSSYSNTQFNSNFDPLQGLDVSEATVFSPGSSSNNTPKRFNFFSSSKGKEKDKEQNTVGMSTLKDLTTTSSISISTSISTTSSSTSSSFSPADLVSQRLLAIADALLEGPGPSSNPNLDSSLEHNKDRDGEVSARLRYLCAILQARATAKDYDAQFPSFTTFQKPSGIASSRNQNQADTSTVNNDDIRVENTDNI